MRSAAEEDLTARALIRNAALALFAAHGPDAVTLRQIAAAAQVSPALVVHHFGSKAGLRQAVDDYATTAFARVFDAGADPTALAELVGGDGHSLAAAFARVFPEDSPLLAYLRRLLTSGDPAGMELFRQWHAATKALLDSLEEAGLAAPSRDREVRAAFLLANDLAVVLLRDQLRDTLGFDPLSPAGVERWGALATSVYAMGVWKGDPT